MLMYISEDSKGQPRELSNKQAHRLWDSFVYLRLKCPTLDVVDAMAKLETYMTHTEDAKPVHEPTSEEQEEVK